MFNPSRARGRVFGRKEARFAFIDERGGGRCLKEFVPSPLTSCNDVRFRHGSLKESRVMAPVCTCVRRRSRPRVLVQLCCCLEIAFCHRHRRSKTFFSPSKSDGWKSHWNEPASTRTKTDHQRFFFLSSLDLLLGSDRCLDFFFFQNNNPRIRLSSLAKRLIA